MPSKKIPNPRQEDGTQCVIVLQVLRPDHPKPWTRREIKRKLSDIDQDAVSIALERLHEQGVIRIVGNQIEASPWARHLDDLGFTSTNIYDPSTNQRCEHRLNPPTWGGSLLATRPSAGGTIQSQRAPMKGKSIHLTALSR